MQYHNLNTTTLCDELLEFSKYNLQLWENNEEEFITNIFTVILSNDIMLNEIWENLTAKIAFHFQSNLEKEIELWNIYIIFFIEKEIEQKDLKYKIENDHYCARKIIIDSIGDIKNNENRIKIEINKKLFNLKIPQFSNPDTIEELENEINQIDPRLTDIQSIKNLINNYKD